MNLKSLFQRAVKFFRDFFDDLPAEEQHLIDEAVKVTNWIKDFVQSGVVQTVIKLTPTDIDDNIAAKIISLADIVLQRLLSPHGSTADERLKNSVATLQGMTKDGRDALFLKFASLYVSEGTHGAKEPISPSKAITVVNERYRDTDHGVALS